jgi:hypothetical protein
LLYCYEERKAALDAAVDLFARAQAPPSAETVLAYATAFLGWITGAQLRLIVDPITYDQGDPARSQPTRYNGGIVQLTDTQQVLLSVEPLDSKGEPTSDTLTWSSSDTTVISLVPSADTLSCLCVAGVPSAAGSAVTVTVGDGVLSASESFNVIAGTAASLVITAGTPEAQPPAAPPAGP